MNAIIAVPKLYTQVLHLMNKMNLPCPFGPVTSTPSLVSFRISTLILKKNVHIDLLNAFRFKIGI